MVLPVSITHVAEWYNGLTSQGRYLQSMCQQLQAQIASGTVQLPFLLDVLATSVATVTQAQQVLTQVPPGSNASNSLITYVQQQTGDPTLNVLNELNNSMAVLQTFIGTIPTEYPKDANGKLLDRSFNAGGQLTWASVPASSLPNTTAALANWLATIA